MQALFAFSIWLAGMGSLLAGLLFIQGVVRRDSNRAVLSILLVALTALITWINPIMNIWLFQGHQSLIIEEMRTYVGGNSAEVADRFGEPRHIKHYGGKVEYWYYDPGPWYLLYDLDGDVAFKFRDGKVIYLATGD